MKINVIWRHDLKPRYPNLDFEIPSLFLGIAIWIFSDARNYPKYMPLSNAFQILMLLTHPTFAVYIDYIFDVVDGCNTLVGW